jgi:hypothetical protein
VSSLADREERAKQLLRAARRVAVVPDQSVDLERDAVARTLAPTKGTV